MRRINPKRKHIVKIIFCLKGREQEWYLPSLKYNKPLT
jgi:hypothetical protein